MEIICALFLFFLLVLVDSSVFFFFNFSSQGAADTMRIHVTKYNALQEKMHKMEKTK